MLDPSTCFVVSDASACFAIRGSETACAECDAAQRRARATSEKQKKVSAKSNANRCIFVHCVPGMLLLCLISRPQRTPRLALPQLLSAAGMGEMRVRFRDFKAKFDVFPFCFLLWCAQKSRRS
eukprot:2373611-Rhodomonas_salina.2